MGDAADDIREDIETTRADLGEKIQQLTDKAHEAVDLRRHIGHRPWVAVGTAVVAGFLWGRRSGPTLAPTPRVAGRSAALGGRGELGLLGDAALLVLTSLAKDALRGRLRSFGWYDQLTERPRRRTAGASRARKARERLAPGRNGDRQP